MAEPLSKVIISLTSAGALLLWMCVPHAVFAENFSDPTRPPTVLGAIPDGNAATPVSGPVLQSVLISAGRKVAIISGKTVKLGDEFGEARVVKITESEVVLRNGKELQTLKLFPDVEKRLISSRTNAKPPRRGQ